MPAAEFQHRAMSLATPTPIPLSATRSAVEKAMGGRVLASRYKVGHAIGVGGMGCVYSALDLHTGREVAIKGLTSASANGTNRRRLHREAECTAPFNHRNVCEIYGLAHHGHVPFIVMERLRGETLRDRLSEVGALSVSDAVTITFQILDGLGAAHAAGIMHRDVKPANIFITSPRGAPPTIKIVDFGLARRLPYALGANEDLITDADAIPGTPNYMAPEQLAGVPDLDARLDIWAVGLTLWEMLIGRRAYEGTVHLELARKICLERPAPPSSLRCDVPEELDAIVKRAVEKDRRARFSSAAHMHGVLLDVWIRHYTAEELGISSGRKFRPDALTLPDTDSVERGSGESTDIPISVSA
jgi:serine/threonine-protein kinase